MFKLIVPALLAVAFATGCAAVEPDSYSEQGKTTLEDVHAAKKKDKHKRPKWLGHMNQVHIGMSQIEVKSILGKPTDTDSTEMESYDGGTTVMDNWTYGDMFSNEDGTDMWMLSFTDGKLDSKSRI
jgi:hypothetical protein